MELITLKFLDKHQEHIPLADAITICKRYAGVIVDAETENKATQQRLYNIIDRDTWLIEQQNKKRMEKRK